MRLTSILLKYRPEFIGHIPKYRGNVYTGKHRFVPPVKRSDKLKKLDEILEEETVMMYLREPYISKEEEITYLNSQNKVVPEYHDDYLFKNIEKPMQQKYAIDFLKCLDKSRRFEEID